jgi:SagB-type dehydrogenase family enzyme
MEASLLLSLRPEVSLNEQSAGQVTLEAPFVSLPNTSATFKQLSPALRSVIDRLLAGDASESDLSAQVLTADGIAGLGKLNAILQHLAARAMLCHTLCADGDPLVTITPLTIYYRFNPDLLKPDTRYVLSRFAHCRREQDRMILESPLSYARVELHGSHALSLLSALVQPQTCHELTVSLGDAADDLANQLMNLLLNAQALSAVEEDGSAAEDHDPALAQWEFHDLLFHSRSRLGRHNNPFGKAYPFEDQIKPLPAIKPDMSEDVIPLYKPDLDAIKQADPPFSQVLENRRSIRSYADQPITDRQLGEFLYRAARVEMSYEDDKGGVTFRPYPGGGALHALEIYPVIGRCENIPSGLYHYNPQAHHLCRVSEQNWYVDTLLEMAWHMIAQQSRPQILFVIAARFQRIQWKYASIAYSVILKDLGGLYQTMYLVAEAMGLAPCALGGGHSDLFAQAAGLNYYAETSVGGFVLGSRGEQKPWILGEL